MKITNTHKITLGGILGLLIVLLFAVTFKEGMDNPSADNIKCAEKGLKCNADTACCEGLKCLGQECK
jgi:hypothetical protein